MRQDVLARDPATTTGAGDLCGFEAMLTQEAADRRGHAGVRVMNGRCRRGGRVRDGRRGDGCRGRESGWGRGGDGLDGRRSGRGFGHGIRSDGGDGRGG